MPTIHTATSTAEMMADFGPASLATATPPFPPDAIAYCRRLARARQENFPVLSRLLDPALVDPFAAVYAFCRWADDLADEHSGSPDDRATADAHLIWWESLTTAWHRGDPPTHPVFVALDATCRSADGATIPLRPLLDLIDAFRQDQRVTRYDTWGEVLHYCARSANPVGRLVLALAGVPNTSPEHDAVQPEPVRHLLHLSDTLCTALQLINFWQDVRRDLLDRDRVYLPRDLTALDDATLRDFAGRPEDPAARVRYIRAVRPLVQRTREMFERARPLPHLAPRSIRKPLWLFWAGGMQTLRRVEAIGCATLWRRPALSKASKGVLVARAMLGLHRRARAGSSEVAAQALAEE